MAISGLLGMIGGLILALWATTPKTLAENASEWQRLGYAVMETITRTPNWIGWLIVLLGLLVFLSTRPWQPVWQRLRSLQRRDVAGSPTGSAKPQIRAAPELEGQPEGEPPHISHQFRWRVWSRHGLAEPEAWVDCILDEAGTHLGNDSVWPIQLHWSNNDGRPKMYLPATKTAGETFGVCAVRMNRQGEHVLVITGDRMEPVIPLFFEHRRVIRMRLAVTTEHDRVEQWFAFQPDEKLPMLCRAWAVDPPATPAKATAPA